MKHECLRRLCAILAAAVMTVSSALAAEAVVDTSSLILRKSASKSSKALQTLSEGDKMDILAVSGDWYKVRYGKYTGYVMAKYVDVKGELPKENSGSTASSSGNASSSGTTTLRPGASGSTVKTLQTALKNQGYYTGSIDGKYGSGTTAAVKAFQKKKGLTQDGIAGPKTQEKLYAAKEESTTESPAEADELTASITLRPGATGKAVKELQQKLKKLDFYTGSIDGKYGSGTSAAVTAFQKKNGLSADGVAGPKTIAKILSGSASSAVPATESLDWFECGNSTIPRGAVFTIKDVKTGKTFKAKRWAGSSHSDTEPLTSEDTAIMREIYGGSWSWDRRAILVSYNGHVYAASMNGMPHGTTTISNGFSGHFCVHFTGSKTHGTDRVDADHQNAVQTAMKATW